MGLHHSCLREMNAYRRHTDELVENEIDAGVGQRGITNGRSNALIPFVVQIFGCQLLIRCIAPIGFPHLFVHFFSRTLGQTLGQDLRHHLQIVVGFIIGFHRRIHCSGKCPHSIFDAA